MSWVEFYEDTDGPNWDDDTDWLSHAPLDDWRGVDTGADGRVTVLELPSNSLSGAIPTVVGDLTGLEVPRSQQERADRGDTGGA